MKNKLFGITVESFSKSNIREKIKKYLFHPSDMMHIVSLNAENIVIAEKDSEFKQVLMKAQIKTIDGIGVYLIGLVLGYDFGHRIAGVDLMEELLAFASRERLRVVLIGGKKKIAEKVIECQKQQYPKLNCVGIEGIVDIHHPTAQEEQRISSIVLEHKPNLIFVAFGSPFQEKWISHHRDQFHGMVCMGVGGAFDYLSGTVPRAPFFLRRIGFEWIFRLFIQPWRIKRQLRLVSFVGIALQEVFDTAFQKVRSMRK